MSRWSTIRQLKTTVLIAVSAISTVFVTGEIHGYPIKNLRGRLPRMRIQAVFCFATAVLISQLALAEMPMSNDLFGKSEGTLDFCAQVKPASAAKYQERKKSLAKNATEKELADARESKEYQDAYSWITNEMRKMPKDQVSEACNAILQDNK